MDDDLDDNQQPITEDYLQDAVDDVERSWPDDNPEDAPAGGRDQLKEAVKDDMPGDTRQAVERQLYSPNERRNQFSPEYFDTEENQVLGKSSPDAESVADSINEEETKGDPAADDPRFEGRIG